MQLRPLRPLSRVLSEGEPGHLHYWCPGCDLAHCVTVDGPDAWLWNRDEVLPTFDSSIVYRDGELVCHAVIVDGYVHFMVDSTHALAGETVLLPPFNLVERVREERA